MVNSQATLSIFIQSSWSRSSQISAMIENQCNATIQLCAVTDLPEAYMCTTPFTHAPHTKFQSAHVI